MRMYKMFSTTWLSNATGIGLQYTHKKSRAAMLDFFYVRAIFERCLWFSKKKP